MEEAVTLWNGEKYLRVGCRRARAGVEFRHQVNAAAKGNVGSAEEKVTEKQSSQQFLGWFGIFWI